MLCVAARLALVNQPSTRKRPIIYLPVASVALPLKNVTLPLLSISDTDSVPSGPL